MSECEYVECTWSEDEPDACPMCSGEVCNKCGAGCWSNRNDCEHDSLERHEKPDFEKETTPLTSDMDDMQLLELAAKSIDYKLVWQTPYATMGDFARVPNWNPLRHDWEALRLAVQLNLRINIDFDTEEKCVHVFWGERASAKETGDPLSATRRAIVRAAAEIGLEKK